jgi:galactokinase
MGLRAWAPGRVNLIGDHTDYVGGLVLPLAIGLGVEVTGDRGGDWVMLGSEGHPGVAEVPLSGGPDPAFVEPRWARYIAAVVAEVAPSDGFVGMIQARVPEGKGLSSSAALAVAVATALGADRSDPLALAQACQRAEHRAVGVPCGIMDQLVAVAARADAALRIDCRSLEATPVALPHDLEVLVADSGESRDLSSSDYAVRRAECEAAEELIGPLRDATPADAEGIDEPVLRRRARHVITENGRVDALVSALAADDVTTAGELLASSHASLRDDFAVSTPALDALVGDLRGTPGVFGARVTGAGFGGCVVALCRPRTRVGWPVVWRGRPVAGARLDET